MLLGESGLPGSPGAGGAGVESSSGVGSMEVGMAVGVQGAGCRSCSAGAENSHEGGRNMSLQRQVPARLAAL